MTTARLYRPSDEPDLVRLAAEPMPGWARLRYDCAAGYAAAEALKGQSEIIVVEDAEGRVAGCGTRSTTLRHLDGEPARIGYLSGLRSFPERRGGFTFFRGLGKLHELERANPNAFTFLTILAGNPEGRALLTSGRVGLPTCRPRGKVVTYALSAKRGRGGVERADLDELRDFYEREAPRKQLFPVFGEKLPPGLSPDDFFAVRSGGRIVGAGAVWSHGERRRIVVDGYCRRMRAARPVLNAFAEFSSSPRLPPPGGEFPCSYLAYALAENDEPSVFAELVDAARRLCSGRNLILSLQSDDPLRRVARTFGGWQYGSEFMTVAFDGNEHRLHGVPYVEAGAL